MWRGASMEGEACIDRLLASQSRMQFSIPRIRGALGDRSPRMAIFHEKANISPSEKSDRGAPVVSSPFRLG
jgi:hypothetical protein